MLSRAIKLSIPLVLALALGGCPEDEVVVPNLFIEVSSDAPESGRLESLRIMLQKGAAHYPARPDQAEFNPALGALDPAQSPVLLSLAYDGDSFGDGRAVVLHVQGRIGNRPVTRFEGQIDLGSALIVKVHLDRIPSGCDEDDDGFFDCEVAGCCVSGSFFADCAGDDASANPWAAEPECEPCEDTVDQDCSGGDQPCVDGDGDQIADCAETCGLGDPDSGPGKPEICDNKDNDCDASTDEGLTMVYGGQLLDKGDACGLGACAGGLVECNGAGGLVCSSDDMRAAVEDCQSGADDNCNGLVNEGCVAADFDGDGSPTPADCNDFDAGTYPGRTGEPCCPPTAQGDLAATQACDKNCDGDVIFCEAGDADGDGVTVGEGDCNDNDPRVAPGKPEKCGDGIDQDCAGGDLACDGLIDTDGDGWSAAVDCDDDDEVIRPDAVETCNGRDDDCDLMVDEGDPGGGAACGTSDVGACALGGEHCQNSVGISGTVVCVGAIDPAAADICDGRDEDCDGETDEDFAYAGQPIGAACDGVGACGAGVVECAPGRTDMATCSTNPDGSASQVAVEVCDALDNDCDGMLNEGVDDVAASDCLNLGVCAANRAAIVATCNDDGSWACDYGAVPGFEAAVEASCDALDNDCDGGTDEDFSFTEPGGAVRPFGAGCDGDDSDACQNGVVGCSTSDPSVVVCAEVGGPQIELCDAADNDCDGATDEDFLDTEDNRVRLSGALLADDNGAFLGDACGAGACAGGTVECATTLTLRCSTDPRTAASPSAPTDTCDGVDNDCDGVVDEAYIAGGTVKLAGALFASDNGKVKGAACGTGECAGGTVECGSATTLVCSTDVNGTTSVNGQLVPRTDTCNNLDDNCNGTTDDDFVATSGTNRKPLANALFAADNGKIKGATCGTGECRKDPQTGATSIGTVVCNTAGTALICSSDSRSTTDVCDDLDNDCDGSTDDPFLAGGTTTLQNAKFASDNGKTKNATCGTGSCVSGKVVCASSGASLVCNSDSKASTDICDGSDNDCDGSKDEDYFYNNLAIGQACDGIGACGAGTVTCVVGSTSAATCSTNPNGPSSQATTETCDGADNDCDAVSDEGFSYNNVSLGGGCSGVGECGSGTVVCSTQNPNAATCSTLPDGTSPQSSPEECDDADNDCDGATDEGFGVGDTCPAVGICAAGVMICNLAGDGTLCSTTDPESPDYEGDDEICDGLDQDCDGSEDDGFPFVDDSGASRQVGQTCDGVGECGTGTVECASVSASRCSTNLDGSEPDDEAELCDGLDQDCDGTDDNGFMYEGAAIGAGCEGIGECGAGTVECATTSTTTCSTNPDGSEPEDEPEDCDQLDNDCDTFTDSDDPSLRGPLCADQDGACAGARKDPSEATCQPNGTWDTFLCDNDDYQANNAAFNNGQEICDNVDNDCDTMVDQADNNMAVPGCANQVGECSGSVNTPANCQGATSSFLPCGDAEYLAVFPEYSQTESCDGLDNDCDGTDDEGFPQIDADFDGFIECLDCNDALGNSEDLDGDNICDQKNRDECTGGVTVGCDDNCPVDANPDQADTNANAIGDACDPCTSGLGDAFEVCGDCLDNDCNDSTDGEETCYYRRVIAIETDVSGVAETHSIALTFDHAFLRDAGLSTSDTGDDIRIYYRDPVTGVLGEIHRVLDPESSWDSTDTTIWFSLEGPIAGSALVTDYYLYAGVAGTPEDDEGVVFHFADFFDRDASDTVGNGWTETETGEGKLAISANSLTFSTNNNGSNDGEDMRPVAFQTFDAITSGRWLWRTRWSWSASTSGDPLVTADPSFALVSQLGDGGSSFTASPTANGTYPSAGVGPNAIWGRTIWGFASSGVGDLGASNGTNATLRDDEYDGGSLVSVSLDMDAKDFAIDSDDDADGFGADIAFNNTDLTQLNAIRLIAHDMDGDDFPSKAFDYVLIRRQVPEGEDEPRAYFGVKEPLGPGCDLDTGALARWYLDDARDDPAGASATTLSDAVATPVDLTRAETGGQPSLADRGAQHGLRWTAANEAGTASSAYGSTKIAGLHGSTGATLEIVADIFGLTTGESFIVDLQEDSSGDHQLALSMVHVDATTYTITVYFNDSIVGEWDAEVALMGRTTFTVVIDSTQTEGNRLKLYRDGHELTGNTASATITANATLDFGVAGTLRVGNDAAGTSSPLGYIYYTALYPSALSAQQVSDNAAVLRADDDRR